MNKKLLSKVALSVALLSSAPSFAADGAIKAVGGSLFQFCAANPALAFKIASISAIVGGGTGVILSEATDYFQSPIRRARITLGILSAKEQAEKAVKAELVELKNDFVKFKAEANKKIAVAEAAAHKLAAQAGKLADKAEDAAADAVAVVGREAGKQLGRVGEFGKNLEEAGNSRLAS